MADLEIKHWGDGEIRLTACSERGAHWLQFDQASHDDQRNRKIFEIGDTAYYPTYTEDMLIHEIENEGLVISS